MASLNATTSVRTASDYVDEVGLSHAAVFAPVIKAAFAAAGFDAGAYDRHVAVVVDASAGRFALVLKAGDLIAPPAGDAPDPMSAEQLRRNLELQAEAQAELERLAAAYEATQAVS